jgi:UDPglucose 6-dehydrogenase
MRITIFGSGYVGLVTGACMAEMGNQVLCYDIDEAKIARLNNGEVPIYEPGLDDYIARNVEAGRLEFTTDVEEAVGHGLFQFVAVGTPPDEDGSADLKHVLAVATKHRFNQNSTNVTQSWNSTLSLILSFSRKVQRSVIS